MRGEKPLIALFPSYDDGSSRISLLLRYIHAVEISGGIPFVLPLTQGEESYERLAELCDGAVFPGGDDVYPHIFGDSVHEGFGTACRGRDKGEFCFFRKIYELKKPFLGICRGIQLINVALGGTLYQDIPLEYGKDILHRQPEPYSLPSHKVNLSAGSKLLEITGTAELAVNSMHHQAVKSPGRGVKTVGLAPDGTVEAIEIDGYPYGIGVEWHPEWLINEDIYSKRIFESFIAASASEN